MDIEGSSKSLVNPQLIAIFEHLCLLDTGFAQLGHENVGIDGTREKLDSRLDAISARDHACDRSENGAVQPIVAAMVEHNARL